ncbi:hypothetical protein M427DRAFT_377896 [Gonapodya prolifera JEL478]|uniref:CRAL-TRIO domain-containing protein n=1 Tax=Gonapodya prolifera (strain JEL478) TaxID=1344416 RepID=A0A139AVD6_GONPJ|nr:hypothetical protein M427DRAFT_377896 [Gonapodya prolifera JEL478]|eukprot:KXS20543.1 hypothetical protein M427DRAFT_377896 [Gonapodya prolifera JEL478]
MLSSSPTRGGDTKTGTLADLRELLGSALVYNGPPEDAAAISYFDDDTLERYLRAYEYRLKSTADAVQTTIKWRLENKPYVNKCADCAKDPQGHSIRLIGFDKHQRPVGYLNFWQAMNRFDATSTAHHMYCILEEIINVVKRRDKKAAEDGQTIGSSEVDPGQVVWICDFDGFGVRDCSPMMMIYIVRFLAHFPDRLGLCVLLNTPSLFSGTWSLVEAVLPTATASKIHFVTSSLTPAWEEGNADVPADPHAPVDSWVSEHLGDEIAQWVANELWDNTNPLRQTIHKRYWEYRVDPRYSESPKKVGDKWSHDPRGLEVFIESKYYALTVEPGQSFSQKWDELGESAQGLKEGENGVWQ